MDRAKLYDDVIRFHGHECPGAALGVRVAEMAVARLGRHLAGNELVAVVETDACAGDAIQVITGCTFGKRNLRHEDNGKNTFSFWRRTDGDAVRILAKPDSVAFRTTEIWGLSHRIDRGAATAAEADHFAILQAERIKALLAAPDEEILIVDDPAGEMPGSKPLHPSAPCEQCAEPTTTDRLHNHRGRMLCPPCHLHAHGGSLPADHGAHHHHH